MSTSKASKWLPLYRVLKLNNYTRELRPNISNSIRESDPSDLKYLSTLIDYYRTEAESAAIMAECFPASTLAGQDLLKRVANIVGLELPKQVTIKDE